MLSLKLAADEKLIVKVKKHWFVFFTRIFIYVMIYILIEALLWWSTVKIKTFYQDVFSLTLFVTGVLGTLFWTAIFFEWLHYYLDVWIVTSKRVFDIEQRSIFFRDVSEFNIDKIQDITVEIHGFFATLFNFGTLHVQTAGTDRSFFITNIPDPHDVARQISLLVEKNAQKGKNL